MTSSRSVKVQRAWARIAGLLYWVVLAADLTGMQVHGPPGAGQSLMLAGSLLTVPLAFGLYFALRPVQSALAAGALSFRLAEAALGIVGTTAGFATVSAALARSAWGRALLSLAEWDRATAFSALVFTAGSTIFFFLFVKSKYIPRVLAYWGLFASIAAMAACVTHLIQPAFAALTIYAWLPMLLAETSTGLWLLLKSVKVETPSKVAAGA